MKVVNLVRVKLFLELMALLVHNLDDVEHHVHQHLMD